MGWDMGWGDDGRTLRHAGILDPEIDHQYDDEDHIHAIHQVAPGGGLHLRITQVLRYSSGKLIPDAAHVHLRPFSITKWESIYSTVFTLGDSNFSAASFAPVVDDNWRVIGHLGWADGNDILVPEETVRNDRHFWSILQEVRLGEERQQILDEAFLRDRRRPFPNFPPPTTSPPPLKDGRRWRGPENCAPRPPARYRPTREEQARSGPLKEEETDQYLRDLDIFVNGGGKAFVGRHFLKPGYASYLDPYPGRPDGEVGSPKKPFSSGYEFLVLVDPEGNLQGVMDIRKNLTTQHERDLKLILGLIDLTMTILMVIDIGLLVVALFRLGAMIAMRATIQAVEVVIKQEAKAALDLTMQRVRRELVGGAMTGPELAERKTAWAKLKQKFRDAGMVPPRQQFSAAKAKEWNDKIAKRMSELGIPKKDQGAGIKTIPPKGEKLYAGESGAKRINAGELGPFNPRGSKRGINYRSAPAIKDMHGNQLGISVHGNVFDEWKGFDLWNHPTTTDWDRIDAIIAHEWSEYNGLTHWETVELMPETKLAISPRARELSRHIMIMGGEPEMAFTEFTKAEWKAIEAAGKQNAPFEEKMAAAAAAAAKAR